MLKLCANLMYVAAGITLFAGLLMLREYPPLVAFAVVCSAFPFALLAAAAHRLDDLAVSADQISAHLRQRASPSSVGQPFAAAPALPTYPPMPMPVGESTMNDVEALTSSILSNWHRAGFANASLASARRAAREKLGMTPEA